MSNEVANKKTTDVASGQVYDYGSHKGAGFETVDKDVWVIPFLKLLQVGTPEVKDELLEGAKAGMLLNTVTKELYPAEDGVIFQPVQQECKWVEWDPTNNSFQGTHEQTSPEILGVIKANNGSEVPPADAKGKRESLKLGDNDVVKTFYVYGQIIDADGVTPIGRAVISFSSTKIKAYRNWITAMGMLRGQPPMFANRAIIKSVKETSNGNSYFNYEILPFKKTWMESLINPKTETELMETGEALLNSMKEGKVKVDHDKDGRSGGDKADKDAGPDVTEGDDGDEIPF